MISAKQVSELRNLTGAGMMDCKKALTETNGDIEAAVDWLREKGIAKSAKKASRIAAEGLANIYVEGNKAVILEVNSETDFVSKNEEFTGMIDEIGKAILNSNVSSLEEVLELPTSEGTVNELIIAKTAKIGEKLSLRRYELVEKVDNQVFGAYLHMGGKIAVLTVVDNASVEVAKDVAMHIAALNPKYISRDAVSEEEVERERKVLTEQALNEGKPEKIVAKMVEGRLGKFFEDICVVDQAFVKNPDQKVGEFIKSTGGQLASFVRFEVGEGIEKKQDNFAEEVMSQIKKD